MAQARRTDMLLTPRTRTGLALAALLAVTSLSACSTEDEMRAVDPVGDPQGSVEPAAEPGATPTGVPTPTGKIATQGLVTVLDDGSGPQLCTFVAKSMPPQCSGTPLADWDWAEHAEHQAVSGTTWGDFALTGTFDGTTFTVTEAIPAALYDAASQAPDTSFETPCQPPVGGWQVVDPATTNQEAMDATFTAASALPGYAGAWLGQSPDAPDDAEAPDPAALNDPTQVIINVAVTEDVTGAEDELRQTWGGALCVSEAKYSEAELNDLATELREIPGVTGASAASDVVHAAVLFDDGSLQKWADETYGEGRVQFDSTFVPAG